MQLTKYAALATLLAAFAAAPLSGAQAKERSAQGYDTNKDGNVTEAEYLAVAKERFKHLDANKDGNLSKEELSKAREARHKARAAQRAKNGRARADSVPAKE